jgi:hypothetical protein
MADILDSKSKRWINGMLRRVSFYGTREKGYADSGLWLFLKHVKTFDEHDRENPIKPLDVDKYQYLVYVFLHMLALNEMFMPKSRQVKMSWAAAIFATWYARTAPHRLIVVQSEKEDKANALVTKGRQDPSGGRMSFIEHELPWWLKDYNIIGGAGNRVGELVYTPSRTTEQGIVIPWFGSRILAVAQGPNQVRSLVPSLYLGDEAGMWDMFSETWTAAAAAVKSGGDTSKMFAFSSVYAGSQYNDAILEGIDVSEGKEGYQIEYSGIRAMDDIVNRLPSGKLPRGLRSFETPSGMPVLEVHYTADPDKRPDTEQGKAWMERASRPYINGGTASADWQREMEIDYFASGGSLVFPMASDPKAKIWHPVMTLRDVRNLGLKLYAGYDYGPRNPSAFIVWGQAPDGKWYAIDEIYEPCVNYVEHCKKIKTNKWSASKLIQKIVCDPQMMAEDQQTLSGKSSMLALFREQGVRMVPGNKGADLRFVQLLRYLWRDPANPQLVICENCWNLKREVQRLKWQPQSGKVARTSNLPEKIMDKNNHGFDASAYLHDTRPKPPEFVALKRGGMTWDQAMERIRRHEEEQELRRYAV